ncbi:MAG: RND transporter [Candidatus Rokuibacteriota bacterium]|nr:MAG: RND transporter [Candidatus Rokubacteria bacterium]
MRPGPIGLALAAGLGAALLLAACTVGPDYVRPGVATPAPDAYKELDGWKVAQPTDDTLRGAWWELFGDPGLASLEAQVDVSSQTVAAAEAQLRQARALVQAARASYFPTITVGLGFTRSRQSATVGTSTFSAGRTTSTFQLPIDVSWEPDLWGRIRRSVESSRASAQASQADLETARLSIQAEVAQDYFQLRAVDAERALLDATVTAYQRSLELTRNRYASGVASRADVLQAETQWKTTQAQAVDLGVQRAQLEHAIALLVGQPASGFALPVASLTAEPPGIPVGLPSALLERRPDVAAAERRVAAANAQIGVAEAAYFPTVTLSVSGGLESGSLSRWLTWPSRFWSVGPGISQTVFDGGLRKAQTDEARAAYDQTVAAYRQAVLTGFKEVEDNLAALRILEEEARVQDEAVAAARQTVTVVTNQYRAGTVSYLDVVVAQTTTLTDERAAVDIRARRMAAAVLLIKGLGGGWDASRLSATEDPAK